MRRTDFLTLISLVLSSLISTSFCFAQVGFTKNTASAPKLLSTNKVDHCLATPSTLVVSFLNVGQGDSILITCPNKIDQTLIDAGDSSKSYPKANELFLSALNARINKNKRIKYAILSHPHQDHSYGFTSLLSDSSDFKIDSYIDNGADNPDSQIEEDLRKKVKLKGFNYVSLENVSRQKLAICPNVANLSFELKQPDQQLARGLNCPANLNDCSIRAYISYQGINLHLLADATTSWERLGVTHKQALGPIPAHILKVGHHGANAASWQFIQATAPLLSILSTGEYNLGTTAIRRYPHYLAAHNLGKNTRESYPKHDFGSYNLKVCHFRQNTLPCSWTNLQVPTTLLSTAHLGTIDLHIRNQEICLQADKLSTGINFVFANETLAGNLEQ